jgi:hypothetical protein
LQTHFLKESDGGEPRAPQSKIDRQEPKVLKLLSSMGSCVPFISSLHMAAAIGKGKFLSDKFIKEKKRNDYARAFFELRLTRARLRFFFSFTNEFYLDNEEFSHHFLYLFYH